MIPLQFTSPEHPVHAAHTGQYSPALVIISILIAIFAAFASFSHVELIRNSRSLLARMSWLTSGGMAMGVGIWTMHFTGMVAFQMPVDITYDLNLTLTSVVPAFVAGLVTLVIIHQPDPGYRRIVTGGVLMGAGIGIMHYTGMGAMVTVADIAYNPWQFALSIATAVLLATFALAVPRILRSVRLDPVTLKLSMAVLMGLAVSGMHYVAMSATVFLPSERPPALHGPALDQTLLASVAVFASLIILASSTLATAMRQRMLLAELERERSEASSRHLENRFRKIVTRLPGMVYQFRLTPDGAMSFPYTSEAIRQIYGVEPEAVQQDADILTRVIHPEDLEEVMVSIQRSAETMTPWQHEYRVCKPDGEERWLQGNAQPEEDADGSVLWSGFIMDVSERRQSEDIIHQLAFYDTLTGLPNRRLFNDRLEQACAASERDLQPGALIFIDLDDFKSLNDTMGHTVGDKLLREVADRLKSCLRAHDTVARLGGDEFVVIVSDLDPSDQRAALEAEQIAEKLLAVMSEPVDLNGTLYQCAGSLGICMYKGENDSVEELLRRADVAMYQAKSSGRNEIRFFDPNIHAALEERFKLERELRAALKAEQLELHYQAQINRNGEPNGAEALVRWQHPERGLLGPGGFIGLAEETGLIIPVGEWVLSAACAQLEIWARDEAFSDLHMAVNISARQFHQAAFVQSVMATINRYDFPPDRLKLELTESMVLSDLQDSASKMLQLREHGLSFAMDDFGTGYSSLAYLTRLPFDEVKIDQSFIRHARLDIDGPDSTIVDAIIGLTHNLGMCVVAEGVETAEHQQFLLSHQCDSFQGYLFNRPEPISTFQQTVQKLREARQPAPVAGNQRLQ
ncbi:MAG: EAL domain-containing protein [Natronospirillum sp.]|uniref:bifunctional diguanylate cyclase/phosphodiesterase n=1 Tax=Natronospirillum sp. TaxID=2812955 RepID=UPI0025D77B7A|nr:EAL domain-containing protein [Natronospirillum sp.]MCH8551316.1 EAL domain-containing protein [Natronospirillum sp.]